MVNKIVRSKYIFVENNKIEILFSNYIFGFTFQSPSSKSICSYLIERYQYVQIEDERSTLLPVFWCTSGKYTRPSTI